MKIAIGCDPNAGALKQDVIDELRTMGHEVADLGSEDPIYANVIAMGAQVPGDKIARLMARTWIANTTDFDPAGRSAPKMQRIYDYARENAKFHSW